MAIKYPPVNGYIGAPKKKGGIFQTGNRGFPHVLYVYPRVIGKKPIYG